MKNKLLMLIPLFALTACGTKVSKLGTFGLDRSAVWEDNYYTYFDNDLLEVENTKVTLDKDTHKVFTSYTDANFLLLEERASGDNKLSYYDDFDEENGYGPVMKLSHHNNYIREGVVSKLFNGQLFCHGYFEKARVQIKESGFSSDFGKKLVSSDYLYLQFKSSLDFKSAPVDGHEDDLTINISFYKWKSCIYSSRYD